MDAQKVDNILFSIREMIPAESVEEVRSRLLAADDSKASAVIAADLKNPTTILIISLFLGGLGVDRFMIGDTMWGAIKLIINLSICFISFLLMFVLIGYLTIWFAYVPAIIDWFLIQKATKQKNYEKLTAYLG